MYAHVNKHPENEGEWFEALVALARYLRGPEGCPWDRKQGSVNFAGFLKEECEELLEAFEGTDNAHIEEEWGDTLFCLLATVAAAEEEGRFSLKSALERIHEKMVRRHGHVFGTHKAANAEEAVEVWNTIKAKEKGNKGKRI